MMSEMEKERRIEQRLVVTALCDALAFHAQPAPTPGQIEQLGKTLRRAIEFLDGDWRDVKPAIERSVLHAFSEEPPTPRTDDGPAPAPDAKEKAVLWVNFYADGGKLAYLTRDDAEKYKGTTCEPSGPYVLVQPNASDEERLRTLTGSVTMRDLNSRAAWDVLLPFIATIRTERDAAHRADVVAAEARGRDAGLEEADNNTRKAIVMWGQRDNDNRAIEDVVRAAIDELREPGICAIE